MQWSKSNSRKWKTEQKYLHLQTISTVLKKRYFCTLHHYAHTLFFQEYLQSCSNYVNITDYCFNYDSKKKHDLTVDCDFERIGHHVRRRLWSLWTKVQLSLTSEHHSVVSPVQNDGDGRRHVHWGSYPTDVAVCGVPVQAASHSY